MSSSSFTVNDADLAFILKQIKIAEATSEAYTNNPVTILQAIMDAYGLRAADAAIAPFGLRTVDGTFNSLLPGQTKFGAADTLFPRLTAPSYRNDADGDAIDFDGPGGQPPLVQGNYAGSGTVVDADPRTISNLIVDMSVDNPAAVEAFFENPLAVAAFVERWGKTPVAPDVVPGPNEQAITSEDLQTIPNESPDIGLSPGFNSWMTFFGQFFDHGLDLVTKGNAGTVYIPLEADDPLIAGADGILGTGDDLPPELRFMALTRATQTNGQHTNTTTSFIDQNQTYTSHASHQVFLREYTTGPGGKTVATGRLLDGSAASGSVDGAIGNWGEVKAQARQYLGINLSDFDVGNVPLLRTDAYGKFIPNAAGYAQVIVGVGADGIANTADDLVVSGTAASPISIPAGALRTGHAFLDDIVHHAAPGLYDSNGDHIPDTRQVADSDPGVGDDHDPSTYDDEMLNAHFATGDGRGNENIALSAVHSIFHSEHNRVVEANKLTIIASGDVDFLNEWLLVDKASNLTAAQVRALDPGSLVWDGERLFQAARFTTEMQYQHLVFEEFARRIQPMVDPFVFNSNPEVDASIVAEFAHTVYRFGHSMLTGTVDRLDNNLDLLNGDASQKSLLAMFLNPQAYVGSGATVEEINANLVRGLSRDVGNAIDEFIVTDVRSNLLGLPLDLGALNIARGRDTGIPSLNDARAQLYNDTGLADLKPYDSWADFAANIRHAASLVNFIAAYGTHASILAATTLADKRAAAELIVFGGTGAPSDRLDFLNATGTWAPDGAGPHDDTRGGLNLVDLWIGGLAEINPEFGGMLGTTFNYVFENQMERLQFGDRMYYLTRTQGTHFLTQLEPNTFSDLVMRNSDLGGDYATHLSGSLFITPDLFLELDRQIAQTDYNGAAAGRDPATGVTRNNSGTIVDGHDSGGLLRYTGGLHVVLGGTEGNDSLYGDKGIDTLWGDGGNDYLNAGTESDNVFGGLGDDIIEDPFGDNVLRGNQGNDVITVSRGLNLVFGDQGQDYILLGQDASEAMGGTGSDFILGGAGADNLLGNEGDDWIEGAGGFDVITGENSELFFNSPIVGHDVLFGQGDETDFDAESGDDIMGSGPSVFRYEGMFGFDWGIGKHDVAAVRFDLTIPIFTSVVADILRDRFDHVEALSGWRFNDSLDGDDRGQVLGSTLPGDSPTALFVNDVLTAEGIARIDGFLDWIDGARVTFGTGANFFDGNILLGGAGNDVLQGRGGYDILDGDAWLNVRIRIVHNGVTYSAESMNTDTSVAGAFAGKVYNVDAAGNPILSVAGQAFGGRSLNALLLDRTLNPGELSIVREILDGTPGTLTDNDKAIYRGNLAEYLIEGRTIEQGGTVEAADINGDGFISVQDLDDGITGATIGTVTLRSRGIFVDNLDLIRNIELLEFADQTVSIGATNGRATGTVTISDPTPFDHDGIAATPAIVTPFVGQVLTATLSSFSDPDGAIPTVGGRPVGLTYEWQASRGGAGTQVWVTVGTGANYTVQPADIANVLRAVAVFEDAAGVTERVFSPATAAPTAPYTLLENSATGTIVGTIPNAIADGVVDPVPVVHAIRAGGDAGGRFELLQTGVDASGNPIYQIVVADGGPISLDFEELQTPVDNQYTIVVDTRDAATGALIDTRHFTILLQNVANETAPQNIVWRGVSADSGTALPGAGALIATLATDVIGASFELAAGSSAGFSVNAQGEVTATAALAANRTYTLNVRALYDSPTEGLVSRVETFLVRTGANGTANAITMGAGDDVVYGLSGADTLTGGGGDDALYGQAGNDRLVGGVGNDTYFASGGPAGDGDSDTIVEAANAGTDTVVTADASYTLAANLENLVYDNGVAVDGSFAGTGNAGNNVITGGSAGDVLAGAGGDDTLNGGFGGDSLAGGAGNDRLVGDVGNDTLGGGAGADLVDGGVDDDLITYAIGDGADSIDGGAGTDTLGIAGTAAANTLTVTYAGGAITAVAGITIANLEAFSAALAGGADTLSYAGSSQGIAANLSAGTAAGFTSIADIENLTGGSGDDTLTGATGANNLGGGDGFDTLVATVDNVRDTLAGGAGTDTADYGAYGTGLTVTLDASGAATVGGSGSSAANSDVLTGIENVTTGAGNDNLTGNATANALRGGLGNDSFTVAFNGGADTIDGGGGTDSLAITGSAAANSVSVLYDGSTIVGIGGGSVAGIETVTIALGAGSDTLSYLGSSGSVTVALTTPSATGFASITAVENVVGGSGNDQLSGSAGNVVNLLDGSAGNDVLNGLGGGDVLIGGDGQDSIDTGAPNDNAQDRIRFSAASEFGDTVTNFDGNAATAGTSDDRFEFGGALRTAWDDGTTDGAFTFSSGSGGAGTVTVTVGELNGQAEALRLAAAEGVAAGDLGNATAVAAAFDAEFNLTAATGEDALLVVNATSGTAFALWQWVQSGTGAEVDAGELELIALVGSNAAAAADNFGFF